MKARRQKTSNVTDIFSGIAIFCPACQCAHAVPIEGPHAWTWNGDVERPTLHPSIKVTGRNAQGDSVCHSVVTDGNIYFAPDSTHKLAGQTVPLEEDF